MNPGMIRDAKLSVVDRNLFTVNLFFEYENTSVLLLCITFRSIV